MQSEQRWGRKADRVAVQERSVADANKLRTAANDKIGHVVLGEVANIPKIVPAPLGEVIYVDFSPRPEPPDIVA